MLDYFVDEGQRGSRFLVTARELADSTLWHVFCGCKGRAGQVPCDRLGRYLGGVAAGLHHMHKLGIVHADASLKNVLLSRGDVVKVTDFGSASALGAVSGDDEEITTSYVRAPEWILGQRAITRKLDIWAFGVHTWMLSTGTCPWLRCDLGNLDGQVALLSALAANIGPIPDGKLRALPNFGLIWQRLEKVVAPPPTPEAAAAGDWPVLWRRALCWDPDVRAGWSELRSHASLGCGGSAATASGGCASSARAAHGARDALVADGSPPGPKGQPSGPAAGPEASPAGASHDGQGELCGCSGNCGHRRRKNASNRIRRQRGESQAKRTRCELAVCDQAPLPGGRYCMRCKCEFSECASQRVIARRWCRTHAQTLGAGQYAVPAGLQQYGRDWPLQVKLIARMAFILPYLEPSDNVQLRRFIREHRVLEAGALSPERFAALVIAHLIKWPPVVQEFSRLLAALPQPPKPSDLVTLIRQCLAWAHGKRWPQMFKQMNGNTLNDAQTGLAVHACRLALIARSDTALEANSGGRRFRLGRAATEYDELEDDAHAISLVENMFQAVAKAALSIPTAEADVKAFANSLAEVICDIRSFKAGEAGLKGGTGYNQKSLLRTVLVELEVALPGAFDALPFASISAWCPDKALNAAAIGPKWTGHTVRERFGCSPLMWHCWACIIGRSAAKLPQKTGAQLLAAPDEAYWALVLTHEGKDLPDDDGGDFAFPPVPGAIVASVSVLETLRRPSGRTEPQ